MTDALFAHGFLTDGDVANLISSKTGLAPSILRRTTRICDLQLSWEEYATVLVAIEDHFDIEIDDLVGVDCATVGALMDRLKDRVARSRRIVALDAPALSRTRDPMFSPASQGLWAKARQRNSSASAIPSLLKAP